MVTIDSITTRVQAVGLYDSVKLSGTVNVAGPVESVEGSIYAKTDDSEIFIGTFYVSDNVSVNINEKHYLGFIPQAASAIVVFANEVLAKLNEDEKEN